MTIRDWISTNCKFMRSANFWNDRRTIIPLDGPRNEIETGVIDAMLGAGITKIKVHLTHPAWSTTTVFEGVAGYADPYVIKMHLELYYTAQNSDIPLDKSKWYVVTGWDLFKDGKPIGFGRNISQEGKMYGNEYNWQLTNKIVGPYGSPKNVEDMGSLAVKYYINETLQDIKARVPEIRKTDGRPFTGEFKPADEPKWSPEDVSDAANEFENQSGDR